MAQRKVGIVLSGGGYKGVAHAGVVRYLEELGVEAELVSGTSAGALVGAMYAAGYRSEDMFRLFKDSGLFRFSTIGWKKPGILNPEKFASILLELFPENQFSALKKPLYTAATNLTKAEYRIFHEGALIPPLLASAAFPGLFAPVLIEGDHYTDGGIMNNFPLEPLLGTCDRILGVSLLPLPKMEGRSLDSVFQVLQRIFEITYRFSTDYKYGQCDLVIAPQALNAYFTFDFRYLDNMFEIGYAEAKQKREEILRLFDQ